MNKGNFKNQAKLHQLQLECFKGENQADILNRKGRAQPHWLNENAAARGKIFYEGYDIFGFVQKWRDKTDTPEWFYDTLRSQHIPFNFFVPLKTEKELCKHVLNRIFQLNIAEIQHIEFEFPPHRENPLNDHTSFDVFIAYTNVDNANGLIGIEVKYTEGGYSLGETEWASIPEYYKNTNPEFYLDINEPLLTKNSYRQIWRNHLLASNYKTEKFQQFLSVTLFPAGNDHFVKTFDKYNEFLTDKGKNTLKGITYEDFFKAFIDSCKTEVQRDWIKYLIERYLVSDQEYYMKQIAEAGK